MSGIRSEKLTWEFSRSCRHQKCSSLRNLWLADVRVLAQPGGEVLRGPKEDGVGLVRSMGTGVKREQTSAIGLHEMLVTVAVPNNPPAHLVDDAANA